MKKATIARFVMGMAAIFAVGCSAETGAEGVGATSEALHGTGPSVSTVATNSIAAADERKFAAQCRLVDSVTSKEYIVLAGGLLANGTVTNSIIKAEATTAWASAGVTLPSAVVDPAFVQDPNNADRCIVAGGETAAGAAVKKVTVIRVNNGTWTATAATDLNVARSQFALSLCGSQLIALAGHDGATVLKSIETSDALAPTAWTTFSTSAVVGGATGSALAGQRHQFAFAKEPGANEYIVAGGYSGSASVKSIELIKATIAAGVCTPTVTALPITGGSAVVLSNAVSGNVAFPESGTAGVFVIAAGATDAGATPTTVNKLTVTWGTPSAAIATPAGVAIVGRYRPTLVGPIADAGFADAFQLVGGATMGATVPPTYTPGTASNAVDEYQSGSNFYTPATLTVARFGNSAVLLTGVGQVYSAAGQSAFGMSPTFPTTVDRINP